MKRGGPLRRRTPLKADPTKTREWARRTAKPLPQVSVTKRRRIVTENRTEIRAAVFARDGYRCQMQAALTSGGFPVTMAGLCFGGLQAHHLHKDGQGGAYTMENLLTLCGGHNVWVEDHPVVSHRCGLVVRRGEGVRAADTSHTDPQ